MAETPRDLSIAEIHKFLLCNDCKATNRELVKHFKKFFTNPETKSEARKRFKVFVNILATIQNDDCQKFLILREKYIQELPSEEVVQRALLAASGTPPDCLGARVDSSHRQPPPYLLLSAVPDTDDSYNSLTSVSHRKLYEDTIANKETKTEEKRLTKKKTALDEAMAHPKAKQWVVAMAKANYHELAELASNNPELVQLADPFTGYTVLHWAAKHGKLDVIKLFAGTYKVNVAMRTNGGYTPLHIAMQFGRIDVFELLCNVYGANRNLMDWSGKKPMDYNKQRMGVSAGNYSGGSSNGGAYYSSTIGICSSDSRKQRRPLLRSISLLMPSTPGGSLEAASSSYSLAATEATMRSSSTERSFNGPSDGTTLFRSRSLSFGIRT